MSQLTSAASREISVTNVINTFLSRPPLSILDEQILALQDAPEMSVRLIKFNDRGSVTALSPPCWTHFRPRPPGVSGPGSPLL